MLDDTIAAIATPLGEGGLAVVLRAPRTFTTKYMNTQTSTSAPTKPNGAGLLVLGLLSLFLGPFTAIPGLLLSKRFRPFTATASVGYFLCWLFLVLSVLSVVLYICLGVTK